MDFLRGLWFLALLAFAVSANPPAKNARGASSFTRQSRRAGLNEYLVPPPPPSPPARAHPAGRTGRVLNQQHPGDAPGYFQRLMGWLNPFSYYGSGPGAPQLSPPPPAPHFFLPPAPPASPGFVLGPPPPGLPLSPPPAARPEYSAPPIAGQSPPSQVYTGSSPTNGGDARQGYPGYPGSGKGKNCNPCNKLPWIPMQHTMSVSDEPVYGVPPVQVQLPAFAGDAYLPPIDLHGGHSMPTSHEVRLPDFAFEMPHGVPLVGPLPNVHLYPGPMPPLFKATLFNFPPRSNDGDASYLQPPTPPAAESAPPPLHLPPNGSIAEVGEPGVGVQQGGPHGGPYGGPQSGTHDGPYGGPQSGTHDGPYGGPQSGTHDGPYGGPQSGPQSGPHDGPHGGPYGGPPQQPNERPQVEFHQIDPQQSGPLQPPDVPHVGAGNQAHQNFGGQNNAEPNNFFPSGFADHQSPEDHFIQPLSNPGFGNSPRDQGFTGPEITDHSSYSSPAASNNHEYRANQQNSGASGNFPSPDHSGGDITSGASNQGFSNSDGLDHRGYGDDLSSSGTVPESSRATVQPTLSTSGVDGPIHFEQSPLLDLTKKGDSRSDSASASSNVNSFVDFDASSEATARTPDIHESVTKGHFQSQQESASDTTESFLASDQLRGNGGGLGTPPSPLADTTFYVFPTERNGQDDHHNAPKVDNGDRENLTAGVPDPRNVKAYDASYIPPSAQPGYLWPIVVTTTLKPSEEQLLLGALLKSFGEQRKETADKSEEFSSISAEAEANSTIAQGQQGAKKSKQVQVIIPYTSQYTPLPFQQSYGSRKGLPERTQPRKVSFFDDDDRDSYFGQAPRKQINVANAAGRTSIYDTKITVESTSVAPTTKSIRNGLANKLNNSIDVHRLQKNIDNWTIQEYSRGTTSSTALPSSSRPYLLPSKKIPDEYLTTTESGTRDHEEIVRTYALAGFSFNDLDHEVSASNRVEGSRVQVIRADAVRPTNAANSESERSSNATTGRREEPRNGVSASESSGNRERVYVVTPQTVPSVTSRTSRDEEKRVSTTKSRKPSEADLKKARGKSNGFESIERAYQVLPQAVNNLAVASTGPETVPLWGIMEHEEFASMTRDPDEDDDDDGDDIGSVEAPVLYAGHSKVSRGRR